MANSCFLFNPVKVIVTLLKRSNNNNNSPRHLVSNICICMYLECMQSHSHSHISSFSYHCNRNDSFNHKQSIGPGPGHRLSVELQFSYVIMMMMITDLDFVKASEVGQYFCYLDFARLISGMIAKMLINFIYVIYVVFSKKRKVVSKQSRAKCEKRERERS